MIQWWEPLITCELALWLQVEHRVNADGETCTFPALSSQNVWRVGASWVHEKTHNRRPFNEIPPQHSKIVLTQNSCRSVRWLMFSIFFMRLAAMSRVVSFFCEEGQTVLECAELILLCIYPNGVDYLACSAFRNTLSFYNSHCFPSPQWPRCHCGSGRALWGWRGSADPRF